MMTSQDRDRNQTPRLEGDGHVPPSEWLWLASSVLLSLALRIPFFKIPMLADEGGYAYATRGWVNGTGRLYDDLWISRPQGIFFIYAGIFDLFGTGTVALRFAAWIAIAVTIVALWGFARLWIGPRAALLAAFLFAVMSSLPNLEGYSANAEMFMGAPAALAMVWLLRLGRSGWPAWQLLGTGVLLGAAISLKPSAAVMVPVAIAFVAMLSGDASWKIRSHRAGWLVAGIAVVGGASLLHGWILGWDDFFYATVTYRLTAQSAATVGLEHNLEAMGRLAWRAGSLVALTIVLLGLRYTAQLAMAGSYLVARSTSNGTRRLAVAPVSGLHPPGERDGTLMMRLWLVGSIVGASIGGDWWSHYLIQVVAPLALWMAATLLAVWGTLRRPLRLLLAGTVVVLLVNPFWVVIHGSPTRMADAMFSHPGYPAQDEVAQWLREHSEPGTEIYVAFDQASIYYLADRPPAYRHLYDQELRGIPSSYTDLIAIIRSDNRPRYIVSTRQPGPFADDSRAFWQEVGVYYELVETIDGVPIYQDKTTITTPPGGDG